MLDNNPAILRTVNALRRSGVRIAVDDFGSGSSSLAALRTFPASILKIDGTLVRDVGRTDGGDDPMVRSIIQLAHSLDLSVCAEWVTTDDQLKRLQLVDLARKLRPAASGGAVSWALPVTNDAPPLLAYFAGTGPAPAPQG